MNASSKETFDVDSLVRDTHPSGTVDGGGVSKGQPTSKLHSGRKKASEAPVTTVSPSLSVLTALAEARMLPLLQFSHTIELKQRASDPEGGINPKCPGSPNQASGAPLESGSHDAHKDNDKGEKYDHDLEDGSHSHSSVNLDDSHKDEGLGLVDDTIDVKQPVIGLVEAVLGDSGKPVEVHEVGVNEGGVGEEEDSGSKSEKEKNEGGGGSSAMIVDDDKAGFEELEAASNVVVVEEKEKDKDKDTGSTDDWAHETESVVVQEKEKEKKKKPTPVRLSEEVKIASSGQPKQASSLPVQQCPNYTTESDVDEALRKLTRWKEEMVTQRQLATKASDVEKLRGQKELANEEEKMATDGTVVSSGPTSSTIGTPIMKDSTQATGTTTGAFDLPTMIKKQLTDHTTKDTPFKITMAGHPTDKELQVRFIRFRKRPVYEVIEVSRKCRC